MTPRRIQLSRAKGFNLQAASIALNGLAAVNVARPGPWGNPFIVGQDGSRADCIHLFRMLLGGHLAISVRSPVAAQREFIDHAGTQWKNPARQKSGVLMFPQRCLPWRRAARTRQQGNFHRPT